MVVEELVVEELALAQAQPASAEEFLALRVLAEVALAQEEAALAEKLLTGMVLAKLALAQEELANRHASTDLPALGNWLAPACTDTTRAKRPSHHGSCSGVS